MATKQTLQSVNPATEEVLQTFAPHSRHELNQKLKTSEQAFREWSQRSLPERSEPVLKLRAILLQARDELARLITSEMGKPIKQAQAEIEKCASLCEYDVQHAPEYLRPQTVTGNPAQKSYIRFDPLGPVLAVMPWNYPFWQVMRFAVPGLLAGNTCVLKHASNVLGSALRLEQLFLEAGYPKGVFQSLNAGRDEIASLVKATEIKAVTLTGSEGAGRAIAAVAGESLKKCVLELGGSDPFIVLPDADMEATVAQAVEGRTQNNGQSCIAAKRFIIHQACYREFVDAFTARLQALKIGDPQESSTQIGPLAREDLRETLDKQVQATIQQGAKCTTGGRVPDRTGWYYPPTLLSQVTPDMTGFHEELFGPVASVIKVKDHADAVRHANLSNYGLGASIWTRDLEQAEGMAAQIDSGAVFINQITMSHASVPFGGVKNSGYGRELGEFGIREFVNIKTVWIAAHSY